MKSLRFLLALSLFFAAIFSAGAYQLEQSAWPKGAQIVMHLGLGSASVPLQDGFASWNASAADALAIWNGYLDFITASSISSPTVAQASGDGINSTFFANTIFGDSFGQGVLAVTVILKTTPTSSVTKEADVVVNSAYRFDSYRGPLQPAVYDFHRIVLHEFGHVLGLAHTEEPPLGTKIMEPVISNLDHLGYDDTLGITRTYGATISAGFDDAQLLLGDPFLVLGTDFQPNNNATSFSVVGLPPGLTANAAGTISGNPTASGFFSPVLIAHGPIADAFRSLPITVAGLDRIPGLLQVLRVGGYAMIADPIRPRIYAAGPDGINMIDTTSFAVTNLVAGSFGQARPSLSADASRLLYTLSTESPPVLNQINLETLASLPALPIPANSSAVREGLDNRDFVTGPAGVFQFDRTTGVKQELFATGGEFPSVPDIAISTVQATLFVTRPGDPGELSAYDVTGSLPVLVQTRTGSYANPIPTLDGQYLYYNALSDVTATLTRSLLPNLEDATAVATTMRDQSIAIGDGIIYAGGGLDSNTFSSEVFALIDPTSLRVTAMVDLGRYEDISQFPVAGTAVFDSSGKYLFVSAGSVDPEVWVFTTDLPSLPPAPPDHRKNLQNVSTRAIVGTGEEATIGGFIISGSTPKKVIVRGLGPSLPLTGAMDDPVLDLYDASGKLLASNDNWETDKIEILQTDLAPSSPREAAISITLAPGNYTAVLRDSRDQPGLGLMEVYDLDIAGPILANLSTRGKVEGGDNVMIGGFIIGGFNEKTKVLVRAIGPSLAAQGILQPLNDPVLTLHGADGTAIATNDNWRSTQQTAITATGIAPTDDRESAIIMTLGPGNYTAIVSGKNGATGVALVEVYNLDSTSSGQ